jgi:hypothetical protein
MIARNPMNHESQFSKDNAPTKLLKKFAIAPSLKVSESCSAGFAPNEHPPADGYLPGREQARGKR